MIITNLLLFILLLHYTRPLGTNLLYHLLSAVQRIFIYYFYEGNIGFAAADIFGIMRAAILINSTVLFISAFKIFKRYLEEKDRNDKTSSELIEIKADKRIHLVKTQDILYLEGNGELRNLPYPAWKKAHCLHQHEAGPEATAA